MGTSRSIQAVLGFKESIKNSFTIPLIVTIEYRRLLNPPSSGISTPIPIAFVYSPAGSASNLT